MIIIGLVGAPGSGRQVIADHLIKKDKFESYDTGRLAKSLSNDRSGFIASDCRILIPEIYRISDLRRVRAIPNSKIIGIIASKDMRLERLIDHGALAEGSNLSRLEEYDKRRKLNREKVREWGDLLDTLLVGDLSNEKIIANALEFIGLKNIEGGRYGRER